MVYVGMDHSTVSQPKTANISSRHFKDAEINAIDGNAYYDLGIRLYEQGKIEEAIACYGKAVKFNPQDAEAFYNMGVAFHSLDKPDEAIKCYLKATEINPNDAQSFNNIGIALNEQNKTDEAIDCFQKALRINPDNLKTYYALGNTLNALGKSEQAIECYHKYLEGNPGDQNVLINMSHIFLNQDKLVETIYCCEQALLSKPGSFDAYYIMGKAFINQREDEKALSCFKNALKINPNHVQSQNYIGNLLRQLGQSEDAMVFYFKAIKNDPSFDETYYNMGVAYYNRGQIVESISCYRQGLQNFPGSAKAHSNLLFTMNLDPNTTKGEMLSEAKNWWQRHGNPAAHKFIHNNLPMPHRPLKIGYVSPDFRRHSVSCFFLPLLSAHDRNNFEIFCYYDTKHSDNVTDRIKNLAHHWRTIAGLTDQAVADQVHKDSIDILVDLAGHTVGNRMIVFAQKPAPIQITWLGYPNTTGIPVMDYRITDGIADPEGEADKSYAETLIRLPDGFLCYSPLENTPDITSIPARETGRITFGSFNNLTKLNEKVIELWSTILRMVPKSRIILKSKYFKDNYNKIKYQELFSRNHISSDRVELLPFFTSPNDHLDLYGKIDIALDPFPYNGTTTTCEALWMGVPVITLCGDRHVSRVGASILSRIKLEELIAKNEEEYVSKAVELARNHERMIGLRAELRKRMKESPLCTASTFARSVEAAYRKMWIKWCEHTPATYTKPNLPLSTNLDSQINHPGIHCRMPIEMESQDDVEKAFSCDRRTADLNSNDGDAYYNLGIELNEQSRVEEAVVCYRKAVDINPHDADAHYNLGLSLNSQKKSEEAIYCYQKVLDLKPHDSQAYNNMGIAYKALGNINKAIICYRKALEIDPKHIQAYNNLGIVLRDQDNIYDAIDCYRKVLELKPDNSQTYNNMGNAYKDLGNTDEALVCFRKALEISPNFFQAYNNMGTVLLIQGKTDEAISCYSKAIEIKPGYADAYYNMGNAYKDQEKTDNAISSYIKAIEIDPYHSSSYFNMATALNDQGKTEDAIWNYHKAIEIEPDMAKGYSAIGSLLNEQGKVEEAFAYYQKALRIKPDPGLEIKSSLLLPVIPKSMEEMIKSRNQISKNLNMLSNNNITLDDPLKQVGILTFLLAYHGLNDKGLQKEIASFYIKACPELTWTSPDLAKQYRVNDKINIGMVSTFLYGHTIGQLFYGLIKNLSRQIFHVTIFRFPGKEDSLSKSIDRAADEVVHLPYELAPARRKIADHSLDILFFLDIGMDPITYFLAFSRLAPVQCKRGHPVTSGVPNLDYFLSPGAAEIPEAEGHYSEQLVRLKTYGYYYYRPEKPKPPQSREHFGLPKDSRLYVCPQTLFKFHPDYDHVFGNILQKDPHGLLILIEGKHRNWAKMLLDRFARSFPDKIDRVRFLPRMSYPDFLSLCMIADAVLDTPIFSGGKTSLDCFAFGIPIVTLPGEFMRGRLTLAQYKLMDVMDCVAKDEQDFVNISLRLANDKIWKEDIKRKITANSHVLFESMEAVRELEAFFEQAVQKTP